MNDSHIPTEIIKERLTSCLVVSLFPMVGAPLLKSAFDVYSINNDATIPEIPSIYKTDTDSIVQSNYCGIISL